MSLKKDFLLAVALVAILVACVSVVAFTQNVGRGQAVEPNMHARTFNMSTSSVGVYAVSTIASERTVCASRVITTFSNLYLSFDDDTTPTGVTRGHYQAASTTVAYDAEQYGCGAIQAITTSTSTVTVTEFHF